jgi:NADPH-dependent glutamate synthase beta subunit-like oxidoreductase
VLLASGAWRDRPLPVEGIDEYIGRGFYYQNPFVDWFNHHHEPGYDRFFYEALDNAIVIGGGLASIDVVKILMLETTAKALKARGLKSDILTLEHQGIPKTLESLGVKFADLGIKGCTLFYRRRNMDMPLGPLPPEATPERIAKLQEVRVKILANARRDYLFGFEECCKPVDKIVDGDRLAGLVFRRTEMVDGRMKDVPNSEFAVRAPLTISSIGSIPEPIPGVPARGELFVISDENTGKMDHYEHVFALGNAVTGRGNIRESEQHAKKVVQHVLENFLSWREEDFQTISSQGWETLGQTSAKRTLTTGQIETLINRLREHQRRVGYDGNYQNWAEKHRPLRLEDLLGKEVN